MHPLSFLLILFASSAAALPATQATPTSPPPAARTPPGSPQPPPLPFLPTGIPLSTGVGGGGSGPAPSPIYSTLTPKFPPSNSSSSTNSSLPCASIRRPLRLGPARLHKKPSQTASPSSSPSPSPSAPEGLPKGDTAPPATDAPTPAAAVLAAAAETAPADSGPRDYASLIPPAPGVTPRPEPNLAELGYYQTTYYSCATRDATVHCGWHRPVMVAPANNAAGSASAGLRARAGAGLGALVVVVVSVLVAG
ncbi:hypothetical protein EsH8_V_000146 [Colletotrichum jinshuiense]